MNDVEPDTQDEAMTPQPEAPSEVQPLRVWAEKAGHLPETFEGDKMRPVHFNRKSWLPRAVCARLALTLDSPIEETTYLNAVADVSAVDAR
jgi:hypothetical protein